LNEAASPFECRNISFDFKFDGIPGDHFSNQIQVKILEMLLDPKWQPLLKNIRHITITSSVGPEKRLTRPEAQSYTPGSQSHKWLNMAALISAIPRLQTLNFEAYEQTPLSIIEVLIKHHPKAHLYVSNWTRWKSGKITQILQK
jgi:hypothetical protein